jgi:hypothetical protein
MQMLVNAFQGLCRKFRTFYLDESGLGTVEVILITIVVIGLVVIFKDSIIDLVKILTESMAEQANSV